MTYKPDSEEAYGPVNLLSSLTPSLGAFSGWTKKLRSSSGTTRGELELPEAAPLIFPALDDVAFDASADGAKKKSKMKNSGKFVADYFDRRAQAQYAADNPGSSLAQTDPVFKSRYADPNHPANSGCLVSLVTGGAINTRDQNGGRSGLENVLGAGQKFLGRGGNGGLQGLLGDRLGRGGGGGGPLGSILGRGSGSGGSLSTDRFGRGNGGRDGGLSTNRLGRDNGGRGAGGGGLIKKVLQKVSLIRFKTSHQALT